MSLSDRLQHERSLSPSEREVASFILKNAEGIPAMSIRDVADHTFTSTTTVLRLCKKIGCSGFQELKHRLALDMQTRLARESDVDINLPFDEHDSEIDIASKIAGLSRDTISSCCLRLEREPLRRAVETLIRASSIIAVGVSDSFIRLIDFQNKMLKIDVYVKITYLQPDQTFLCTHSNKGDAAILASYSGQTAEVINEARILKDRGVPIIAITSNAHSPVGQLADIVLLLPPDEQESVANYSLSSQISIEYVLNVLFSCIYSRHYQRMKKHLLASRQLYLHR